MTHRLSEQHFTSYENTKNWVDSWIALKDEAFFRRVIHMLPERWERVVASDGQYFEQNISVPSFTINAQFLIKKTVETYLYT